LELVGRFLRRAVLNGDDLEARVGMAMAATFAGMGFGNAGVHVPHAVAYPIAGLVREYLPAGYAGVDGPLVPHGQSVIVTAPATFAFTYPTAPERHLRAAELLGASLAGVTGANGRELLPATVRRIVEDTGGPGSISSFGYGEADVAALVEGTLKQERLLSGCPREIGRTELERIVRASMTD
jgi:alcohol dehydrogenase class IV